MSPPDGRSRPGEEAAPESIAADNPQRNAEGFTAVHDLRRRRAASYRLPPLGCGRADPWRHRC